MNPRKLPDEHERRLVYTLHHLSKIIIPTTPYILSSKVISRCDTLSESIVIELQRIIYESTTLMDNIRERYEIQSKS
jgi:hypothetical protein